MAVPLGFRVGVDGSEFCKNIKKYFYIYVDLLQDRTVKDIENRIKCMLHIDTSVWLMNEDFYLPSTENVRLLNSGDILKVVEQSEEDAFSACEFLTGNIENCKQMNFKEKKKRKRDSSKNESYRADVTEVPKKNKKNKMKNDTSVTFDQNKILNLTLKGIEQIEKQCTPKHNYCKENSEEESLEIRAEAVNLTKKARNGNYTGINYEQSYALQDVKPQEKREKKLKLANYKENIIPVSEVQRNESVEKSSKNETGDVQNMSYVTEQTEIDQLTFKENQPGNNQNNMPSPMCSNLANYIQSSTNIDTNSKMAANENDLTVGLEIEKSTKKRRHRIRKHKNKKKSTNACPLVSLPKPKKEYFIPIGSVERKHIRFEEDEEDVLNTTFSVEGSTLKTDGHVKLENVVSAETENIFGNTSASATKWDIRHTSVNLSSGYSSSGDQFNRLLSFEHSSTPLICERRKNKPESISQKVMSPEEKTNVSINHSGDDVPKENGEIPSTESAMNIDFSTYPKITELSKVKIGDIAAFKILKMDENYSPKISEFVSAKILAIDEQAFQLTLLVIGGHDQCQQPKGKFSLEEDDGIKDKLFLNWNEMIDTRLLFP